MLHSSLSAVVEFPFSWVFFCFCFFKYCDGFSHSSTWIGHRHSCVPSLLPHPIPASCHRAVALDAQSYIKLPLAIYFTYGNIYVSIFSNHATLFLLFFSSFSLALFFLSTCCDWDLKFKLHFFSTPH